ncbi:MAG TPA: ATP-binding protein [Candidatus Saccharimonadales bacterium]|nr:ATP-binding protein [Candidatus Saccharimonadales bacterium]
MSTDSKSDENQLAGNDEQQLPLTSTSGIPVELLKALSPDAEMTVSAQDKVGFFLADGRVLILPQDLALTALQQHKQQAEEPSRWPREFPYRPSDGAVAAARVLERMFGVASSASRETLFGVIPAARRTVKLSLTESIEVPWETVTVPALEGLELYLYDGMSREYGQIFRIMAQGPRKYETVVTTLFDAIEQELKTNSIYRGKALTGAVDHAFLDYNTIDFEKIVLAEGAQHDLEAKLWNVIRFPKAIEAAGVPLVRKILLHGPFGTGKSSIGLMTAKIATENNWTYIHAKIGEDVNDVLTTGRIYGDCVVLYEDIERSGNKADAEALAKLLDSFDGITSKGGRLILIVTTNHYGQLPKGMLRPGRLDTCIHIGGLDRGGSERLIRTLVQPEHLDADVDYDLVYKAMEGYLPAFVREAVTSAVLYAFHRTGGTSDFVLRTEDLVAGAESLREQFKAHEAAVEIPQADRFERLFGDLLRGNVDGSQMDYEPREDKYVLRMPAVSLNGHRVH